MWRLLHVTKVNTQKFDAQGVFCQSAIENAQNDHAAVVQHILDNKDGCRLLRPRIHTVFVFFAVATSTLEVILAALLCAPKFKMAINTVRKVTQVPKISQTNPPKVFDMFLKKSNCWMLCYGCIVLSQTQNR